MTSPTPKKNYDRPMIDGIDKDGNLIVRKVPHKLSFSATPKKNKNTGV